MQIERRDLHDPDFAGFRKLPFPSNVILDIGANRGQSIASFKTMFPHALIHAFEANPMFFRALEEVGSLYQGTVFVHTFGLGSQAATLPFYIPWVRDTVYLEESSTRRDNFSKEWIVEKFRARGDMRLEETIVHVRRGDELGLNPDLIKLDVEGAEHDVLLGLRDTLIRQTPTLLVENSDWHNVTPFLQGLGYAPFRWQSDEEVFASYYGATVNTFYVHASKYEAISK
jgi:FkbM family methyltransferase